jgi:membrane protein YdbS with pleckstrin-like domain
MKKTEYQKLSKNARLLMFATALLQSLILLCVCMATVVAADLYGKAKIAVMISGAVVAVLWAVAFPLVRFKRYKYLIQPDRVEIIEGVFWVSRTVVPIDRIHQINVSRGPLDTAFGVAKVSVITAGSTAVFRFLDEDKANQLAMFLNEKVQQKLGGNTDVQ